MLFLLPPSETKEPEGELKRTELSFPQLNQTRDLILKELVKLSRDPLAARKALKLGPKQLGELEVNLALPSALGLEGIERYTGVLYEALKQTGLSNSQRNNAAKVVFIQSSLFGLISASDPIPNYRLSAGSILPGVNLKKLWQEAHEPIWDSLPSGLIVDLRSKVYTALAPIPKSRPSYYLEAVIQLSAGERRSLNHFNKQAKGRLVRATISSRSLPKTISDLEEIAASIGMKLEVSANRLLLVTYG